MNCSRILIEFLIKYLFIMSAASEGWRICYVGGNRFEFYNKLELINSQDQFLTNHKNKNLYNIQYSLNSLKKN